MWWFILLLLFWWMVGCPLWLVWLVIAVWLLMWATENHN